MCSLYRIFGVLYGILCSRDCVGGVFNGGVSSFDIFARLLLRRAVRV